jgi:hypothetical protein
LRSGIRTQVHVNWLAGSAGDFGFEKERPDALERGLYHEV